jgi:hypothetical protein
MAELMINDGLKRIWKEMVIDYEVPSWKLPGGTEENSNHVRSAIILC